MKVSTARPASVILNTPAAAPRALQVPTGRPSPGLEIPVPVRFL